MIETARASLHVGNPAKSFSAAEGAEPERRGWDEEMYNRKNKDTNNHYDFSRKNLNFEINSKGEIVPLGSNTIPLHERIKQRLDELGFVPYYEQERPDVIADNSPNCTVTMIFSGNHDVLSHLAFGKQDVDFTLQKSNAHITRQKGIEDWAKDTYDFVCRRYGAENIIGFDVHLDETTAHAHVQIIPVAKVMKRGRIGSVYKEKDNPDVTLSTKEWKKLPKEERDNYIKCEKQKDQKDCVSYAKVFGENVFQVKETYRQLHTDYHEEIGKKYGLERGTSIRDLPLDEQLDHVHKNKQILEAERLAKENVAQMQTELSALKAKKMAIEQLTKEAKQRKDEAEKDANIAELFKELANVAEEDLKVPLLKINAIIKEARDAINGELDIPIPVMKQKEWREERQKNIKVALTNMQTNLGAARDNHIGEIRNLSKKIYQSYKRELAKLFKENEALRKENKNLSDINSYLHGENSRLKSRISKIDANAIERLRKEKDAEYDKLKKNYDKLFDKYNDREERDNIFVKFAEWLSKHPEIVKIMNDTQQKEFEEEWKNAKIELREKCITNAQTEIQNFGKSGQNDYTDSDQISCVLCGIIAIADKLGIDATIKSGCEKATQELLGGVYWFNYRQMQKDMATWRTPQMVRAVGGITDEMVDAFKQYIAGVQPVASVGGSNGAAHSLTHWDGSEVTNGWRAPTRPNFLNYSRKKGKGIGY